MKAINWQGFEAEVEREALRNSRYMLGFSVVEIDIRMPLEKVADALESEIRKTDTHYIEVATQLELEPSYREHTILHVLLYQIDQKQERRLFVDRIGATALSVAAEEGLQRPEIRWRGQDTKGTRPSGHGLLKELSGLKYEKW